MKKEMVTQGEKKDETFPYTLNGRGAEKKVESTKGKGFAQKRQSTSQECRVNRTS